MQYPHAPGTGAVVYGGNAWYSMHGTCGPGTAETGATGSQGGASSTATDWRAAAASIPHSSQNSGLVADLCKIIERQSQEIASLVQSRTAYPVPASQEAGPSHPEATSALKDAAGGVPVPSASAKSGDRVEDACDAEVRLPP